MAVAVSISPMNSAASQPTRFRAAAAARCGDTGLVEGLDAPIFWMSSVADSRTTATTS